MGASVAHTLSIIHWKKSMLMGLVLLVPSTLVVNLFNTFLEVQPASSAKFVIGKHWFTDWLTSSIGGLLWGGIFLGIPAFLVSLLRIKPMERLFNRCLPPQAGSRIRFLLGTFLIFEIPVWVVAILTGLVPYQLPYSLLICQAASLPWLCSSLQVGWKLYNAETSPANG